MKVSLDTNVWIFGIVGADADCERIEIGAFCEWRQIEVIVSDNRDFLRGLAPEHFFEVMSPTQFCSTFGL